MASRSLDGIGRRADLSDDVLSVQQFPPFNAFLTLQGIETLALRMERHCANTSSVAAWLGARPEVVKVIHPSVLTGVGSERTSKYLKGGHGGLVGFELAGGREAGRRFIDSLKLFYHVANIGDARSLAIHPATTTHSQLSTKDRLATGVSDGYVRLSVGIEHIDDTSAIRFWRSRWRSRPHWWRSDGLKPSKKAIGAGLYRLGCDRTKRPTDTCGEGSNAQTTEAEEPDITRFRPAALARDSATSAS